MNRVLIAAQQAETYRRHLAQHLNLPIDLVNEAATVWAKLAQEPYTLLIIEVGLLGSLLSDEHEVMPQLRSSHPYLSVLLLARPNERSRAVLHLEHGATDYLLHPFAMAELVIKARRCLQTHQPEFQASTLFSITDQLMMLNEATQELLQTLQPDKAHDMVLAKVRHISQVDVAKIWLIDHERTLARPSTLATEDEVLFNLAQEAVTAGQFLSRRFATGKGTLAAALLLPLFSGDRLVGVLALGRHTETPFSADQIRWLTVFCQQAAVAIENAQLFHNLSVAYDDMAQSRKRILQSRNTLQTVFDNIYDGLYILNKDLTISALNRVAANRHETPLEELVGQSFLALSGSSNAPRLIEQIKHVLETGHETTWMALGNGEDSFFEDREFRIYPIKNRRGQTEQVVVFVQDVSERQKWQATLFRSANLAAVGQLAGSVAHQINNPLTVTMTNRQLIMLDAEPDSEINELATAVFRAGQRIQSSVANLLEFSNQDEYYFTEVRLVNTIDSALDLVSRSLMKASVQLTRNFEADPAIIASVSHLKLVWVNLLLNAKDAVANFATPPKIEIGTRLRPDGTVSVTFSDNGQGLSPHNLKHAFDPFFTTKPPNKALGLGLYSAQVIVEQHGGHILAKSKPGVFTVFEVILPIKE